MREKILGILQGVRGDVDFEAETALADDGILDSFDIVMLVNELDGAFHTHINIVDIVPGNFNSVDTILKLMERIVP
ncbi:MAG: acyl carrier protein [Bacillota bacterium]